MGKAYFSIDYNGKNSWSDFGLTINSKTIGNPAKLKSTIRLPNSNRFYDYANVFGEFYNERELTYVFNVVRDTKNDMNSLKIQVLNWLMPGLKKKLIDTAIDDYYFMAEIQEAPEFTEENAHGLLTVKFTCYPFKIKTIEEGNDDWDTFNFDEGIAQKTIFKVDGGQLVTIYNPSATEVQPTIITDGEITVAINGDSYKFTAGTYADNAIMLPRGKIQVQLTGKATVQILFYREVI